MRLFSRRFAFLAFTTVLVLALCRPTGAQEAKKIPRVGLLALLAGPSPAEKAFLDGLRDLGYIDGKNVLIEARWAAGKVDRLAALAEELVRIKVDVIAARATPAAQAAKNATSTIPIVMLGVADAIGSGFVTNLARPGGNITGTSNMMPELAGKRLELLKELLPGLTHVAFLAHASDPAHKIFLKDAQEAAERAGIKLNGVVISVPAELDAAFADMARDKTGAVMVQPLFISSLGEGKRIAQLAVKHRLPTISDGAGFADVGGLALYGPNGTLLFRRAAAQVDKILKGAKPGDLPVEQPTKFELVINLKTAKQIGLTIPPNVLARADKVIK